MPPFGHDMSMAGVPKVEGYSDAEAWNWPQHSSSQHPSYVNVFDPSAYANFAPQIPPSSRGPPRHHSLVTSHALTTGTETPPPARPQVAGSLVKAQPAFKPTWRGFLDTTKDAMTVVEASLQGRLNHISRRPHDKERAEMLTSGTVLVYEENASGIKRWTDAVHWSPSRVMNNCLIYRQLVRALKPEEKKTALNPSCGTKRKRKEGSGPAMTKTGETLTNSDDEYEDPAFDGTPDGDADSMNKVYANFAQSLTPDQQRRFCGSLIDSYEFKEGGLMKKTISVKYQGTHHHVISYYSLEDLVNGKLKRPFEDPRLADIQPRPELLRGWKVSLEDEESKDMPLVSGYPHQIQPSHSQHHVVAVVTQAVPGHAVVQPPAPLHLHVPDYWHGPQASQYTPNHHTQQHYASPQSAEPQYSNTRPGPQYHQQQPSPQDYAPQLPPTQQYAQSLSPQTSSPQFSAPTAPPQPYPTQAQAARHYSFDQAQTAPAPPYAQQVPAPQYTLSHRHQAPQSAQYNLPQAATFDVHAPVSHSSPSTQQPGQASASQQDPQRRSSAPLSLVTYNQPQFPAAPYPQSYYVTDAKYMPEQKHAPDSNNGY
ncbi:Gluconate transport-inducing protein required for gluconate-H+ symport [Neocucurbitaria cava]|uniref:Gluconate transport-inducing protein required for gluconate-H+ symport n=1 Tax=Neocucurbitaria cava TaxID=798079 RepID=A0A9W8Y3F6_9PLEO|nr:Gluconate transport-inducing protein required for gluconate-H+ symport [Neocucurbitaria cava]